MGELVEYVHVLVAMCLSAESHWVVLFSPSLFTAVLNGFLFFSSNDFQDGLFFSCVFVSICR